MRWTDGGYEISTEPKELDLALIHDFLASAYWSPNVPFEVVKRSIDNSLCFGLYDAQEKQVGFARVVTDRAVFAYLADVFVLDEHRGRGLGQWLIKTVLEHPDLQGMRRIVLGTRDAHQLYAKFGFEQVNAERLMTLDESAEKLYGEGR